jgi:small subunit ribosomal protein S6e
MAEFKLVIGTKEGKCTQKEVKENDAKVFLHKKIGEKVSGDDCGLAGYEFEITGGSDSCGFPMRKDVKGTARKRILAVKGVGLKKKDKGIKIRKNVCGNTISDNISQINLKVLKEGKEKLGAKKEEAREGEAPAKAEEKKEAPKAEEKKEAPKPEEKKE